MVDFRAGRTVRSHSLVVGLPVADAFTYFEPEGERVVYTLTALSPAGNKVLREMDEARYRACIES